MQNDSFNIAIFIYFDRKFMVLKIHVNCFCSRKQNLHICKFTQVVCKSVLVKAALLTNLANVVRRSLHIDKFHKNNNAKL